MNEKIKELARKADWVNCTDDANWIHPYYQEQGYLTSQDLEKFAKIIISECHREIAENSW